MPKRLKGPFRYSEASSALLLFLTMLLLVALLLLGSLSTSVSFVLLVGERGLLWVRSSSMATSSSSIEKEGEMLPGSLKVSLGGTIGEVVGEVSSSAI